MANDTAAIEQLRDELRQLRESQERIERAVIKREKRDDTDAGKLDIILERIDTVKSILDSPTPEHVLTLAVVATCLTAVFMGARVAYNAYQSAVQALPGQQWGEVERAAIAPASDLPIEQQAFLDTIAQMEGADYTTIYGGSTFSDFSDHPQQCIPINLPGYEGQCSDAAGRYQFISTTWRTLGMPDFSPENQDKGAIALIKRDAPDAIPLLSRGEVEMAFREVSGIWASLPGNSYGQNPKDMATVLATYEANLAALKTAQPSGIEVELGNDGAIALSSSAPLKTGDMIGTYRVSRGIISGKHDGVDLATPEGTPLFVFGEKGEKITVECHEQMNGGSYSGWGIYGTFHVPSTGKSFLVGHLSECNAGTYDAGQVWGYSGNTGKSTGPHTHTEQFTGESAGMSAKPEEPTREYVEAIHGTKN